MSIRNRIGGVFATLLMATDKRHGAAEAEITEEMVEAGARELWNDRDARLGGSWESHDPREVCVIQTKATMRAALAAAFRVIHASR